MQPYTADNRDDSDLRVDAFSAAIGALLCASPNHDREALALLYEAEPEFLCRVWVRLKPHHQIRLIDQANGIYQIPHDLLAFLIGAWVGLS